MNDQEEVVGGAPVVEASSALAVITGAEIDKSIATAHQYPRSLAIFQRRALEMVSLDEDTAESCIYSRPVGMKDGKQQFAEGMSIRMAEIVAACYGNVRVGAMLIEQTDRQVKARGYAHDLESNFASTSEVIESTVDKYGKPYSERMRIVVAKAALAKARRDATFSVIPRALCKKIETEARMVAIGDATTLAKRRTAVMGWILKLGIPTERVFAALNITGEADIGLDQLATLTGLKTAIKDGDVTVDEAFPDSAPANPGKTAKEKAAAAAGRKPTEPATESKERAAEAAGRNVGQGGKAAQTASGAAVDPHKDWKEAAGGR